jgi:hypothetical protein
VFRDFSNSGGLLVIWRNFRIFPDEILMRVKGWKCFKNFEDTSSFKINSKKMRYQLQNNLIINKILQLYELYHKANK